MYKSIYKIDFQINSTVIPLLDFDSDVLFRPRFSGTQEIQVEPLVREEHPAIFARGNTLNEISFNRIYSFPNAYDAQQFMIEHKQLMDDVKIGTLLFQVETKPSKALQEAAITAEPVEDEILCANEVSFNYNVVGKAII